MIVTILIENTCVTQRDNLAAEHGLSLHIRANGTEILFDTGAGGAFADNAARLDVQLDTVQAAVISHHHYDHGGGLARFFQANTQAPVYMRPTPQGDPQLGRCSVCAATLGWTVRSWRNTPRASCRRKASPGTSRRLSLHGHPRRLSQAQGQPLPLPQ